MTVREALTALYEAADATVLHLTDWRQDSNEVNIQPLEEAIEAARAALAEPERCVPVERLREWVIESVPNGSTVCRVCQMRWATGGSECHKQLCPVPTAQELAEYTEREPA